MKKNNIPQLEKLIRSKVSTIALVAPSFVVDFSYPAIVYQLKKLGFEKVVELTFGAKMVNREYHKILQKSKGLVIASPCPGIINTIKNSFPNLRKNIAQIDSPLIAMAKICKRYFPKHKVIFISPCDFKKMEAEGSNYIDGVIDYEQLKILFEKYRIRKPFFKRKYKFDKFYNDYTKIYPLSGGLSRTAHLKGILKEDEIKVVDGINDVVGFLKKPDKKIKFLDCLFCKGGCIGGPHTNKDLTINQKHKKVEKYLRKAERESIPENRVGLIDKAKGIKFARKI
jgi:iron only hydrogenase large subunit-like protein